MLVVNNATSLMFSCRSVDPNFSKHWWLHRRILRSHTYYPRLYPEAGSIYLSDEMSGMRSSYFLSVTLHRARDKIM